MLAAFVSAFQINWESVRNLNLFARGDFIELYCRCDIGVCERRDVRGLCKRACAGEVESFVGIFSPNEEPSNPELIVNAEIKPLIQRDAEVMGYLCKRDLLQVK